MRQAELRFESYSEFKQKFRACSRERGPISWGYRRCMNACSEPLDMLAYEVYVLYKLSGNQKGKEKEDEDTASSF
jgi:hypothetical protein